ncbi:ABC transporter ATP-binding protein [Curtobacterium sp. 9128]|uniref:ABC transporter ATP-binding protein n=1 Tax=Curtobacterium sp. 9128 TaxID=1793722 RepID=UPI002481C783|nr:ABC transporter ATP-binding protein [Curtobacterium sp. 9128]
MTPAAGDDEDVYATSDAAWLTETTALDEDADRADHDAEDDDETAGDDVAEDDTGDSDAHHRPGQDGMSDHTTTSEGETAEDGRVEETGVLPAAAPTSTTSTSKKPRVKRPGRATRPQGAAATNAAATADAAAAPQSDAATASEPTTDAPQADDRTEDEPPVRTKSAPKKRTPAAKRGGAATAQQPVVLRASGLVKRYGQTLAVDEVDLEIRQGSLFGVVGPNGAGKTTTLSMLTGLLRPDAGTATVLDHDVWADPAAAKRSMGVLPDRLRLFDRLTGAQLLFYSATLRGLDGKTARSRSADLAEAFGLGDALGRPVADYSVGMAKKIALAATLIHSPRVLVLDEPFESVDPVSATTITEILRRYTQGGGTVVLSSHSMELVQRTCDSVAIIVGGKVLASGTMAQVRGRKSLEDKFVELAGGRVVAESMEWLHSFSG